MDESKRAVGGSLTQLDGEKNYRVIAYYSKKQSGSEQNLTTIERELSGLVYFVKLFKCYLEGASSDILLIMKSSINS